MKVAGSLTGSTVEGAEQNWSSICSKRASYPSALMSEISDTTSCKGDVFDFSSVSRQCANRLESYARLHSVLVALRQRGGEAGKVAVAGDAVGATGVLCKQHVSTRGVAPVMVGCSFDENGQKNSRLAGAIYRQSAPDMRSCRELRSSVALAHASDETNSIEVTREIFILTNIARSMLYLWHDFACAGSMSLAR